VIKHIDWIASVMGVDSSELLATPGDDDTSGWWSDGGEFRSNSAISFPMKNFDTLRSITLCLFALVIIAFNN
jgi:hypothetical protein